ncbi:hypothetical protein P9112_012254 [Eukaryota sp. TZLM1-RC]
MQSKRGSFIVIEGLDRAGKSSQLELLLNTLSELKIKTTCLHFPDRTTHCGQLINKYLRQEIHLTDWEIHQLFAQNRREKEQEIKTLLLSGTNVICSRYAFSGVAYSAAKGLDFYKCVQADAGVLAPDLVVFLSANPDVLAKRAGFGDERYEDRQFQRGVKNAFDQVATIVKAEGIPWTNIDATLELSVIADAIQDIVLKTIENVTQQNPLLRTMFNSYIS